VSEIQYYLHHIYGKASFQLAFQATTPFLIHIKTDFLTPLYWQCVTPTCFGPESAIFRGTTDMFSQPDQQNTYQK